MMGRVAKPDKKGTSGEYHRWFLYREKIFVCFGEVDLKSY